MRKTMLLCFELLIRSTRNSIYISSPETYPYLPVQRRLSNKDVTRTPGPAVWPICVRFEFSKTVREEDKDKRSSRSRFMKIAVGKMCPPQGARWIDSLNLVANETSALVRLISTTSLTLQFKTSRSKQVKFTYVDKITGFIFLRKWHYPASTFTVSFYAKQGSFRRFFAIFLWLHSLGFWSEYFSRSLLKFITWLCEFKTWIFQSIFRCSRSNEYGNRSHRCEVRLNYRWRQNLWILMAIFACPARQLDRYSRKNNGTSQRKLEQQHSSNMSDIILTVFKVSFNKLCVVNKLFKFILISRIK